MNLLLDTQIAVWWQIAAERISPQVRTLVMEAGGSVFVSRASLWELAIKVSMGKLGLDLPLFCRRSEQTGFRWLDIAQPHLLAVAALPASADHQDPFDRLLVAQSLSEPLILLTADQKLARYGTTVQVVS